jgi:hypothetical protein
MKPSILKGLATVQNLLAQIAADLPEFEDADRVDIGAELRAIGKLAACIVDGWERDDHGKKVLDRAGIKQLIREHAKADPLKPRILLVSGNFMKALFAPTNPSWIAASELKAAFPDIAAKFTRTSQGESLRFEALQANGA